jgi:hypothetical protein
VSYWDVPRIDHAYLAMDTEEGVEVFKIDIILPSVYR